MKQFHFRVEPGATEIWVLRKSLQVSVPAAAQKLKAETTGVHGLVSAEARWGLSTQWRMIKPQKGNSETHCNLDKLESIMLNEISQSQEKCHVTSPMGGPQSGLQGLRADLGAGELVFLDTVSVRESKSLGECVPFGCHGMNLVAWS